MSYHLRLVDWFSVCYQLPLIPILSTSQVVVTHEEIMCWCECQGQPADRVRVAMIWATDSLSCSRTGPISLLPFFEICFHLIKFKQTTSAGNTDRLMAPTLLCDTLSTQSFQYTVSAVLYVVDVTETVTYSFWKKRIHFLADRCEDQYRWCLCDNMELQPGDS